MKIPKKRLVMPIQARFYQKVEIKEPEECWLWHGAMVPNGYGQLQGRTKKIEYAHRVSYELHHGPIPPGLYVCHSCDNKRCVNPNHLWVGTQADNMRDAQGKGLLKNNGGGRKKLTADAVSALRNGAKVADICREYGVTDAAAYAAKAGKTWRRLDA